MRVVTIDPGNSTGFLCSEWKDGEPIMHKGLTIREENAHRRVFAALELVQPDIVVYETFQLYPNKAQHMQWNSFFPCEIIGVVKLWAAIRGVKLCGLQPSVKKFAGVGPRDWMTIATDEGEKLTEHVRDTLRLFTYWYRNVYRATTSGN